MNNKDEIIYGRQTIKEALIAGNIKKVIIKKGQKGPIIDEIIAQAHKEEVVCQFISPDEYELMAGNNLKSGGVAALVSSFKYRDVDEILKNAAQKDNPLILLLDHIEDPHNLGALLRTADASGVSGVIIPSHRAVGVTATVRKVAAGAAEWLPVAQVNNLAQILEHLKKNDFWIYGAEENGDIPFYEADWKRPVCLVLGSEGKGITPLIRKKCDILVGIPLKGKLNSLNVSVAGGILMFEHNRQKP